MQTMSAPYTIVPGIFVHDGPGAPSCGPLDGDEFGPADLLAKAEVFGGNPFNSFAVAAL